LPTGRPRRGQCIAYQRHASAASAADDQVHYQRVDVHTVGYQTEDGVTRQQRADQPWPTMVQRWHGVEQVRRHASPGSYSGLRLGGVGVGVAEADHDARLAQSRDSLESTWQFGRQADDGWRAGLDPGVEFCLRRQAQCTKIVNPAMARIDERSFDVRPERFGPAAHRPRLVGP
jgi:hypothetical protein